MDDLISRSALLEAFGEEPLVWDSRDREDVQMHNDWLDYTKLVKEAPAVDAVEVVFCDNCTSHNNCATEYAYRFARIERPYCCAGKRRVDDVPDIYVGNKGGDNNDTK